jgi:hypothetical protein
MEAQVSRPEKGPVLPSPQLCLFHRALLATGWSYLEKVPGKGPSLESMQRGQWWGPWVHVNFASATDPAWFPQS